MGVVPTPQPQLWQSELSADIAKCPLGEKSPWWRTTGLSEWFLIDVDRGVCVCACTCTHTHTHTHTHTYFLVLLRGLGSNDTTVATSTSSTHILGSNYHSWLKGIRAPWGNGFSKIQYWGWENIRWSWNFLLCHKVRKSSRNIGKYQMS